VRNAETRGGKYPEKREGEWWVGILKREETAIPCGRISHGIGKRKGSVILLPQNLQNLGRIPWKGSWGRHNGEKKTREEN